MRTRQAFVCKANEIRDALMWREKIAEIVTTRDCKQLASMLD